MITSINTITKMKFITVSNSKINSTVRTSTISSNTSIRTTSTTLVDEMMETVINPSLIHYRPCHAGCSHQHQEDDQTNQLADLSHCPLLLFDA
jgi:hypothetical protein